MPCRLRLVLAPILLAAMGLFPAALPATEPLQLARDNNALHAPKQPESTTATDTLSSAPQKHRLADVAPLANSTNALDIALLKDEQTRQLTTFDLDKRTKTVTVNRGQKVTLAETSGTGCITQLWMTFPRWFWAHWEGDQPVSPSILKTLIVRIYWDGESTPAVEAPVGDFFGNGLCEASNFTSRYLGMSSGGFFCKFPMPFRKGFRIEAENLDKTVDTVIFCNVLYQLKELPPQAAYFHAQFHTGHNPGPKPIPVLNVSGRGHYVGCVLSAQGEPRNYLSFLEAPEYVFIDEDWEKPRITGTGLEDYFLGGWYFREGTFAGELHGLPSKDALNSSVAMYRTHEADAIRFNQRIRFEFVNPWEPERLRPFAYSCVSFYYLDHPSSEHPPLPSADELLCWYRIKNTDHQAIP